MTGNRPSRTVVVSIAGSAAQPRSGRRIPAAPARAALVSVAPPRKRRRVCIIVI